MVTYLAVPTPPPLGVENLQLQYGDLLADGRRVAKVRDLPEGFELPEGVDDLGSSPDAVRELLLVPEEKF